MLGFVVSLLEEPNAYDQTHPILGMFIGGCFSAIVSGVAYLSVGSLSWILGWPRSPRLLILLGVATVGALIAFRIGLAFEMWCAVLTFGLGAVAGAEIYLFGPSKQTFSAQRKNRRQFSLAGLMTRVAAASVLIVVLNKVLNFKLFIMW